MVDEDLGHHEVGDYDGDNHGLVLVDRVDTLEVFIGLSDKGRLRGDGASTLLMLMSRMVWR